MAGLVGLLAACCAALLCPPRALLAERSWRVSWWWLVLVVPVVLLLARSWLVPALVLVAASGGGLVLLRRQRAARAQLRVTSLVLEACESMAGDLRAGQPPARALARAALAWPALEPVVAADRLGGSVPLALRSVAGTAGAADLGVVAAAWEVSSRTGQGLAAALEDVRRSLRAEQATQRVVAGELASARATARLVAALPLLALVMGSGVGGDPVGFLLGTVPGWVCLAGGLGLGLAGLAWIEAIAAGVRS